MIALPKIVIMASAGILLYFWAIECAVIQSGSGGSLSDNGDDGAVQIVNQTVDIRIKQKISRYDCCPDNCGFSVDCGSTRRTTARSRTTTAKGRRTTTEEDE
uniref:Secreted protein n=1 Tax=Romanomermis culicivorax TaxID=13658 RepID=A0A915IYK1_ROMCU